ncbi:MAG TPA: VOC family protein [Ktedonobacterales bacterium]
MIRKIIATELIVRDMATCKAFYRDTLGLQMTQDEPDAVAFKIGDLYFFLLSATEAGNMIGGQSLRFSFEGTSRSLHAASVDDVDAMYADLKAKGVNVLEPPTDQPWGLRTAFFTDPEGNFWEINQPVVSKAGA